MSWDIGTTVRETATGETGVVQFEHDGRVWVEMPGSLLWFLPKELEVVK